MGKSVRGVQGEHGEGDQRVEGDGAADVDEREQAEDQVVEEEGARVGFLFQSVMTER